MCSNQEIKTRARAQLQNSIFASNWLTLLAFYVVTSIALTAASSVFGLAGLFLGGAAEMGLAAVCLMLVRNPQSKMQTETVFYAFKNGNYVRSLVIYLLTKLFTFLWTLLFYIPGIVKSYSYSMAYYISLDMPHLSGNDCITESGRIMDGKKWQLFCLDLSFVGWYLLGFLAFGIGICFVVPYHQLARANFYDCAVRAEATPGAPSGGSSAEQDLGKDGQ